MPSRWQDDSNLSAIDVKFTSEPSAAEVAAIAREVAAKGFCIAGPWVGEAQDVIKYVEQLSFGPVHPDIAEGLLGLEGSARVADLSPEGCSTPGQRDALFLLLRRMQALTRNKMSCQVEAFMHEGADDVDDSDDSDDDEDSTVHKKVGDRDESDDEDEEDGRSATLAITASAGRNENSSSNALKESLDLHDNDISRWLPLFLNRRLMLIFFLGPRTGVLRLQLHSNTEAAPVFVKLVQGSIAVVRSDLMTHHISSLGRVWSLTCFLTEHRPQISSLTDIVEAATAPPEQQSLAAQRLLSRCTKRLQELQQQREEKMKAADQEDEPFALQKTSDRWEQALSHSYQRGRMIGVGGIGSYFSGPRQTRAWFNGLRAGPDFITQVPLARWNHESEWYDEDVDSWEQGKSYCRHGAFMDGVDLFDGKFFSLSNHECQSLDPHCRLILEVGYGALQDAGFTKKSLMMSGGACYVGVGNDEWACLPGGFATGAFCFYAGRFSFCLGMKGSSVSVANEAASGLTATHLAYEFVKANVLRASKNFAVATAASLMLAPQFWPWQCRAGLLSPRGRCFVFDQTATGYVRGDSCAALVMKESQEMDATRSSAVMDEGFVGIVAGTCMNSSGKTASMTAPNGPQIQELIWDALRNAGVHPSDVDGVEAAANGYFLGDAIESKSIWRVLRGDELMQTSLRCHSVKSLIGNTLECSGLAGFLRVILSAQYGLCPPQNHLLILNPEIQYDNPMLFPDDVLSFPLRSSFNGTTSCGFGGSNVHVVSWGMSQSAGQTLEDESQNRTSLPYWPGGTDELDDTAQVESSCTYTVVSSCNNWQSVGTMERSAEAGVHCCTVPLLPNMRVHFQLCLNGDPKKVLHPGRYDAPSGWWVFGPEEQWNGLPAGAHENHTAPAWVIETERGPKFNVDEITTHDVLSYRIRLRVAGKWRVIDWEKLPKSKLLAGVVQQQCRHE